MYSPPFLYSSSYRVHHSYYFQLTLNHSFFAHACIVPLTPWFYFMFSCHILKKHLGLYALQVQGCSVIRLKHTTPAHWTIHTSRQQTAHKCTNVEFNVWFWKADSRPADGQGRIADVNPCAAPTG